MADLRLPSLNKVLLIGRLTRDPELRYTPEGAALCRFSIASDRNYKDRETGEWKKGDPLFVDVVVWRELAERMGEVLHKGSPVFVEGSLQSRSWETPEGQKRSKIEIQAFRAQNLEKMGAVREEEVASPEPSPERPSESGTEEEDLPF
ncbi:single-stranded DNA-binding protein [candidate division TA06 bacterium]|nr:single-stranded DNA-binding protein [candidate division TA06 bacterium]